jgi:CheY-like chemotaxis protein
MMRDLTTRALGQKPPISVLIVDSNRFLVDSFQQIMNFAGFNVEIVSSGEEAISKAETSHFDLALVDNYLQDIAGRDLALTLKEQTPGISVMLINGSIEENEIILPNKVSSKKVDFEGYLKMNHINKDNR